jgi:hypothetical protein
MCRNMSVVKVVTVTRLADRVVAPPCSTTHATPVILFVLGGYWHDFTDVQVPLFITSWWYDGEKYETLLRRLSRHAAVDLDADTEVPVWCFPHISVRLEMHREFTIVPELVLGGERWLSMADITVFLREAYPLLHSVPAQAHRGCCSCTTTTTAGPN